MLVVNRFRDPSGDPDGAHTLASLTRAHELLAEEAGYLDGVLGRNLDDPTLWVLSTRWESVGAYRRALSSYRIKAEAVPILSSALDEPSAYEVVEPGSVLNVARPRVT